MEKNTLFGIILVCLATLLNGCAGMESRKSFSQNRQDIQSAQERSDERREQEAKEQPPVTAQEIPGGGAIIKTPAGTVETHFRGVDGEGGAEITLGLGSENVHHRAGKREAKKIIRRLKQENEETYVRERVKLDAFFEHNNPYDFSSQYRFLYIDLYERIADRARESEYDEYRNREFEASRNSALGIRSKRDRGFHERTREHIYHGKNRDVDYARERALLDAEFGVKLDAPTGILTPEGLDAYYKTFDDAVREINALEEQRMSRQYRRY